MKSKAFIKDKLNLLFAKYNNIKIRYEHRIPTTSHLIEILPFSLYDQNEEYMAFESEFESEFESKFPDENILFISEESLSEIRNPEVQLGYNEIVFNNKGPKIEFIIEGCSSNNAIQSSYNYALAA